MKPYADVLGVMYGKNQNRFLSHATGHSTDLFSSGFYRVDSRGNPDRTIVVWKYSRIGWYWVDRYLFYSKNEIKKLMDVTAQSYYSYSPVVKDLILYICIIFFLIIEEAIICGCLKTKIIHLLHTFPASLYPLQ